MGVVGDFSLINPYGVRVKGFLCSCLGLRVAQSSGLGLWVFQSDGSGLRVFQDSGLGLRVRSPDDHVILLIPLYLTWDVFAVSFPHPPFPSHH